MTWQPIRYFFRFVLLPDESLFHTNSMNSVFCLNTYRRSNLKWTNWDRKRGCKCQHKKIVDWCGCSPSVFRYWNQIVRPTTFMYRNYDLGNLDDGLVLNLR